MSEVKPQIACVLDETQLTQRKGQLWNLLRRAASHKELPNGFEFTFDVAATSIEELGRIVDLERQCCKFLRFVITAEPEGGLLRLELSGPEGTREFMASLARFES